MNRELISWILAALLDAATAASAALAPRRIPRRVSSVTQMTEFPGLIYEGPPIDLAELDRLDLPAFLAALLRQKNGFVCFHGGFHLRGLCAEPEWHALSTVSTGPRALHEHYEDVDPGDIAFGEDFLGDQFLLRDGLVSRLYAETGDLEAQAPDIEVFFDQLLADPDDLIDLPDFLQEWHRDGRLTPDKAVHVYPPFCMENPAHDYSFKPIPRLELLDYHAEMSKTLAGLPDGVQVDFRVTE